MGWGKDAAAQSKQREELEQQARTQALEDQNTIAESADDLWNQLFKQVEGDVEEFVEHSHKKPEFRTYANNSNYFVVERPVQPIARVSFLRSMGKVIIELSGHSFSGFTGATNDFNAGPYKYLFGLNSQKQPCFVSEDDGTITSAEGISRLVGDLLVDFTDKYL